MGRSGHESRVAIAAAILSAALANCPSHCSGNGLCGADDKCSCQQLWMGADCSQRRCPYALAWADTADGTNQAHYYAECANKGYCDRNTGLCKCFDGFEGKGCRRSSCPDGCSGHGRCQTIEELSQDWYNRRYGPGVEMKDLSCTNNRQFPSKSGALTASFDLNGLSDANLLVTSDPYFYADAYTGMPVKYDSNYGTKATALADNGIYYLYKSSTANTFVVFTTHAQATKTDYADEAAAKAATGALDVKTGALTGETHHFTEAYRESCQPGSHPLVTSAITARTANTDTTHGQLYNEWDRGMAQACVCDGGYDGADCARRVPPHGDDPMTTTKANAMRQAVKINGASGTAFERQEFTLVYHDPYGGIWRSEAILGSTDDTKAASRVQNALRRLPNEVLEGVKVTGTTATPSVCHRFRDGVQHYSSHAKVHHGFHHDAKGRTNWCKHSHAELAPAADDIDFTVEFNSIAGQTGVQYLLEVDVSKRGGGHYPVSAGITGSSSYSVGEINYNANLGNLSELAECSDRGLDNGEGECECFEGFRGLSCENQEALV